MKSLGLLNTTVFELEAGNSHLVQSADSRTGSFHSQVVAGRTAAVAAGDSHLYAGSHPVNSIIHTTSHFIINASYYTC